MRPADGKGLLLKRVCYLQFLGEGVLWWGWRWGHTRGSTRVLGRQGPCFSWKGTEEAGYWVSGFMIGKSEYFSQVLGHGGCPWLS